MGQDLTNEKKKEEEVMQSYETKMKQAKIDSEKKKQELNKQLDT